MVMVKLSTLAELNLNLEGRDNLPLEPRSKSGSALSDTMLNAFNSGTGFDMSIHFSPTFCIPISLGIVMALRQGSVGTTVPYCQLLIHPRNNFLSPTLDQVTPA